MVCKELFGAFGGKEYLCRWKDSEKANGLMPVTIPAAKLQKKLVKNNGFWKINAIRPKIKAKRGRTRKHTKRGNV